MRELSRAAKRLRLERIVRRATDTHDYAISDETALAMPATAVTPPARVKAVSAQQPMA